MARPTYALTLARVELCKALARLDLTPAEIGTLAEGAAAEARRHLAHALHRRHTEEIRPCPTTQ